MSDKNEESKEVKPKKITKRKKVEEPIIEIVENIIEEAVEIIEEPKEEILVEEPIVNKPISKKEWFERSIKDKNFSIYQNNVLIVTHNPNLVVNIKDDYFEIYGKKYTYNNITIKNK